MLAIALTTNVVTGNLIPCIETQVYTNEGFTIKKNFVIIYFVKCTNIIKVFCMLIVV